MARYIRRHRVLSIRLSDEEYVQLEDLCDTLGLESISELTRAAIRHFVQHSKSNGKEASEARIKELVTRVSTLDRQVALLTTHVGLTPAENGR